MSKSKANDFKNNDCKNIVKKLADLWFAGYLIGFSSEIQLLGAEAHRVMKS